MQNDDQMNFPFDSAQDRQTLEKDERLDFPLDPEGRGYDGFVEDRERAIEQVNKRFGAMIGENVRLKFFGFDDELSGKLMLNTLLLPESKNDDVPLRIGKYPFDLRDVENCVRI